MSYFLGLETRCAMCWLDQCPKVPVFLVFTSVKGNAGDTCGMAEDTEQEDQAAPGSAEGSGHPDISTLSMVSCCWPIVLLWVDWRLLSASAVSCMSNQDCSGLVT